MWRYDKLTPRQREAVDLMRKGFIITRDKNNYHLREFPIGEGSGLVKIVHGNTVYGLLMKEVVLWGQSGHTLNTTEEVK